MRYTDLRRLPSGILFGRVWRLIKYTTTKNSTRCPLPPKFGLVRPDYNDNDCLRHSSRRPSAVWTPLWSTKCRVQWTLTADVLSTALAAGAMSMTSRWVPLCCATFWIAASQQLLVQVLAYLGVIMMSGCNVQVLVSTTHTLNMPLLTLWLKTLSIIKNNWLVYHGKMPALSHNTVLFNIICEMH